MLLIKNQLCKSGQGFRDSRESLQDSDYVGRPSISLTNKKLEQVASTRINLV